MKTWSLLLLMIVAGCQKPRSIKIEGDTMATSYHISYFDRHNRNFSKSVDSILVLVNKSINNYDSTSEISVFNKSKRGIRVSIPYLSDPLRISKQVYTASGGAFDPTVMPLVNAWGFGKNKFAIADTSKIDSLRNLVGFDKIQFNADSVWKTDPGTQIDFGGIGQGYGADVIANFLRSKGVEDMFVELGGEGLAIGHNLETGKAWYIGILDPESLDEMKAYVSLSDMAFTTSGNYYNYREVNGQRFSHIMDPKTGYPTTSNIMSASVFAPDCTTADAWAKVLILLGVDKSIEILKEHPELGAFLVYSTPEGTRTYTSKNISGQLELNN